MKQRISIPDRSGPGLTTAACGAVPQQGAVGNYATVGQRRNQRRKRRRGGRRYQKELEKRRGSAVDMRIGTLNVGSMTGKGREIVDLMERRQVDILCVQETKWKGSKAKDLGAGYKLYYNGYERNRNGVGIIVKADLVEDVIEVKRVSDRVMHLKLEVGGSMVNIVSAYAPQVGCEQEEKDEFWKMLDDVMAGLPQNERVFIGADMNGHVGEGNAGYEEVMGRHGLGARNDGGEMVIDFAYRAKMAILNTYFHKMDEHKVTYKSGGRSTQIDYLLCRREALKEVTDCKVIVSECVAKQHRLVVCKSKMVVQAKRTVTMQPRIRWWKLGETNSKEKFQNTVMQATGGKLPDDWDMTAAVVRRIATDVLGKSTGRRKVDKETWWWNQEVQECIRNKRSAKKEWDRQRDNQRRMTYKEACRAAKKAVAKAKAEAYKELYEHLETKEGEKQAYRLAKQKDKASKDVQQVRIIKDGKGDILTSEEDILERWRGYFENLMNEENERERRTSAATEHVQAVQRVSEEEVRKAIQNMKNGKAVGPDDIPAEAWKCLGEPAVEFLTNLFNRILDNEQMPGDWRQSTLVPIFKNKGDAQNCANYRGIKLMSHSMKIWERVIDARLRKNVKIGEQQYGFMPGRSATDAIFGLRILAEKYREGQKELHCVFIDLEKAYDRVPRDEVWHCLRMAKVAEKYVRVIQDMYADSETRVRCAAGTTGAFKVEVGLHQGSALSPLLFAVVMDQLTKDVIRQAPWTMMFADDIIIASESKGQLELDLERWRQALETRGMKISRTKTEYLCVNKTQEQLPMKLRGVDVPEVEDFKYLGSTLQSNGDCGQEIRKRIQSGWNGWRKMTGLLCDRHVSARLKGKIHRTVVRPAMMYGLETVALTKGQEAKLEVAEMRMLRFELGVTRKDRIRNKYIRGSLKVGPIGSKIQEARLRWYGHVRRRDSDYVGQKVLAMELPGRRRRGRPKRRFMDVVKEDMVALGVAEKDTQDRVKWRNRIRCGDP